MTKLTVAVVQAAPIPLDFQAGIDKALRLAREAVDGGAQVVAFGETFLGGYPLWLDEAPGLRLGQRGFNHSKRAIKQIDHMTFDRQPRTNVHPETPINKPRHDGIRHIVEARRNSARPPLSCSSR